MEIRPTLAEDMTALQGVVAATDLFPPDMLGDMLAGFLAGDGDAAWLSCLHDGEAVGFCYARPEALTDGTWNMVALAVHPDRQRDGCGRAIVAQLESDLKRAGHRLLIVETSGSDGFAQARAFYRAAGYDDAARIPGFWAPGDDKIVFCKAL